MFEVFFVGGKLDGITLARYDSQVLATEIARFLQRKLDEAREHEGVEILCDGCGVADENGNLIENW